MTSTTDMPRPRSQRREILRGGLWSAASQVIPAAGTALLSVAAGRLLGSGPLGQQSLIAYVNSAVTSVLVISLNTALLQVGGRLQGFAATRRLRRLTWWAVGAHGAAGLVVAAVMIVSGEIVNQNRLAWAIIGTVSVLDALTDGLAVRLILTEGWAPIGRLRLLFQLVGPLVGVGFLFAGLGIPGIFLGDGAAALGLLVAVVRRFRTLREQRPDDLDRPAAPTPEATEVGPRDREPALAEAGAVAAAPPRRQLPSAPDFYRPMPRSSGPFYRAPVPLARIFGLFAVGALITQVVSKRVEFIVLAGFSGDRAVGQYSVAFMAVSLASMIPFGIATAAMPRIAGAGASDGVVVSLRYTLRLGTVLVIPIAALLAALGPTSVLFVYGGSYGSASRLVPFASLALLVAVVNGVCEQYWSGRGRLAIVLGTGVTAAIVDVAVALVLVPPLGAGGAVAANVAGQFTLAAGLLGVTVRRTGAVGWRWRPLLGSALAGAAAAAVVVLLRIAADRLTSGTSMIGELAVLLVGAAAGLAAIGAVAMLVRPFERDEAEWLAGVLPARATAALYRLSPADRS